MGNQSIIDMAWQTSTLADAPLQMGDTFFDPNSTLTITALSMGGDRQLSQ
jgi:hypothetical protein